MPGFNHPGPNSIGHLQAHYPSHRVPQSHPMTEDDIRLVATERGLALHRSVVRDPAVPGYGIYWLHDADTDLLVYPDRWGATLDEIERWLVQQPHPPN